MKKIIKYSVAFSMVLVLGLMCAITYLNISLPKEFYVFENKNLKINEYITVASETTSVAKPVNHTVGGSYNTKILPFNSIPIKTVKVGVIDETYVVPCGTPFGIKMFTNGVIVVGTSDVDGENGYTNPAKNAGIKIGDIILKLNGQEVKSNADVGAIIEKSNGEPITVLLMRKNMSFTLTLTPIKSKSDDSFKGGMWVRDSSAGIGILTFYNPADNSFGGLGHPICDVDTGEILPLMSGEVVSVNITEVKRGISGSPGELRGSFLSKELNGYLLTNCETGVYGKLINPPIKTEPLQVALKQNVKTGKATILTTIEGNTPQEYEIEIEKINLSSQNPTKNITIKITDKRLLDKTGGIVQGMSGSPILQDGKLIGAVTHVFVNDPSRGYAIFAENMLRTSQDVIDNVA